MFGFGADKIVQSIAEVAKEWITTEKESAEAKAIMVKALDPNGIMRRQLSKNVTQMYMLYIYTVVLLVLLQSFKVGDVEGVKMAIISLTDLFMPITGMFSSIVLASFGVNGINSHKGK